MRLRLQLIHVGAGRLPEDPELLDVVGRDACDSPDACRCMAFALLAHLITEDPAPRIAFLVQRGYVAYEVPLKKILIVVWCVFFFKGLVDEFFST